ncbi:hypothetical protein ASD65_03055 [Microbacterium sp. Root61]|uniref:oxygenase MpaB family protein n=1 Tax=Microbacterium sp. Root61 TaxID=1736570 RepID=UPI0006FA33E7|nr:oxygenase MpaB family protein [Microbacterium sp. Root61]KRA25871.1 hypothetical protein ASD65_03055 [Microbacterium sp. Root61]
MPQQESTLRTAQDQPRQDDGYFGPDSVSWRLFADPSSKLGGVAAILLQALNPGMMRLFAGTSDFFADAEGRAERTSRYIDTITYGDTAHADAAGASVRRMHSHAKWTDPQTGIAYAADEPAWLEWTHNTVSWGVLRAAELYGPELSRAEQDRFVLEQHKAAELAGVDTTNLARTWAELTAYIDGQQDWMALTLDAATLARGLRKPSLRGNPIAVWIGVVIQDGIIAVMPEWAQNLYGIEGRPMNLRGAARTTKRMVAAARKRDRVDAAIVRITSQVETHPYRKVRARPAASRS